MDQERFGANPVAMRGTMNPETSNQNQYSTDAACAQREAELPCDATKESLHNPWASGSADWDVQNGRSDYILGCRTGRGDVGGEFGYVW